MPGSRDPAQRVRATRAGRQRGCRVYISAEELLAAGFAPEELPYYRVRTHRRSRNAATAIVSLYREP
jgi:hypothetical protein